jgi:hypothetical protein
MKKHQGIAILLVAAVAIILCFRFGCDRGEDPRHDVPDDVRTCRENLREIHEGLLAYQAKFGELPGGSGPRFLAALIAGGIWEDTPENRAKLTCPGPHASPVPENVDWSDAGSLTAAHSAYAVRDFAAHPLVRFPTGGDEPILACDNAHAMNHDGATNVLYADKTVRTFLIEQEIARGRVPAGTTNLILGPESPLPDLRKLRAD